MTVVSNELSYCPDIIPKLEEPVKLILTISIIFDAIDVRWIYRDYFQLCELISLLLLFTCCKITNFI